MGGTHAQQHASGAVRPAAPCDGFDAMTDGADVTDAIAAADGMTGQGKRVLACAQQEAECRVPQAALVDT